MLYKVLEGKRRQLRGYAVIWNNYGHGKEAAEIHADSQMVLFSVHGLSFYAHYDVMLSTAS